MKSTKPRRSANVPGQFLGYSLQTTRATIRLLDAKPGSSVSVEVLDDVAVTNPHGGALLEQGKSAITGNPIGDRSVEFWKTLSNWVRTAEAGHVDPVAADFEIFLSRKRTGRIAEALHAARDVQEATVALAQARQVLTGKGVRKLAASLCPYVDHFFQAPDRIVLPLVQHFSLGFGSGSSKADLVQALETKIISPDMLETVACAMLGWVKLEIEGCIERSQPAVVAADAFRAELGAFVRKYDRFAILNSFAPTPKSEELNLEVQGATYVRQLDLIGVDYDTKLRAANDFLRASKDRSIWATKGIVHRTSFDDFEDVLTRTWTSKKESVSIQASDRPSDERGRLLFAECSLVQTFLEGRALPPHFTPGSYHALAEALALGWHPDFKTVLKDCQRKPAA